MIIFCEDNKIFANYGKKAPYKDSTDSTNGYLWLQSNEESSSLLLSHILALALCEFSSSHAL